MLTKNADPDKYGYSGYGIGFDTPLQFSLPNSSWGKNIILFGVDDSSSVHIDNQTRHILALAEGLTQGLDDTTITAEFFVVINFTQS